MNSRRASLLVLAVACRSAAPDPDKVGTLDDTTLPDTDAADSDTPPTDPPDTDITPSPTGETGLPCAEPGPQRRLAGELELGVDAWATFQGENDTSFGYAVAGVGDLTGDGRDDMAALTLLEPLGTDQGGVYLLASPLAAGVHVARQDAVRFVDATPGDYYDYWTAPINTSMQVLPDLNGDGLPELVLAAYLHTAGAARGTVYVVASPVSEIPGGTASVDPSYARITAFDSVDLGSSIAVGDLDADGSTDLIVSAPPTEDFDGGFRGHVYLFDGPLPPGELDDRDASVTIRGYGELGASNGGPLAMGNQVLAGDVSGDGVHDLIVTSPASWVDGVEGVGEAYVFEGPITADIDTRDAEGTLRGKKQYHENLGVIGAFLGDTDGDGLGEFGLSSTDGTDGVAGKNLRGSVYIVDGPVVGTVRIEDRADTHFYGTHDYDQAAFVASAGDLDLDQDGLMDVGVARTALDMDKRGAAYIYYGPLPAGSHAMEELPDATMWGNGLAPWPIAMAAAGDVDGDCMPDFVVGERFGDAVYLMRGGTL